MILSAKSQVALRITYIYVYILLWIENGDISFKISCIMVQIRFRKATRFQDKKAKQASKSVDIAHHFLHNNKKI